MPRDIDDSIKIFMTTENFLFDFELFIGGRGQKQRADNSLRLPAHFVFNMKLNRSVQPGDILQTDVRQGLSGPGHRLRHRPRASGQYRTMDCLCPSYQL